MTALVPGAYCAPRQPGDEDHLLAAVADEVRAVLSQVPPGTVRDFDLGRGKFSLTISADPCPLVDYCREGMEKPQDVLEVVREVAREGRAEILLALCRTAGFTVVPTEVLPTKSDV